MEHSLCSRQNNRRIGPICHKNKDFNNQYVVEKLIKGLPKKIGSTKVLGLATHSQKVKKGYIFCY